jgi:FkbM family methyltransferase
LFDFAEITRKVNRTSPLPEKLRSRVKREAARLLWRDDIGRRLMGYKLSHLGEYNARMLFNEIFVDACYFFHADNDRPLIVDCGSNIGVSVLFFKSLYPTSRIVAFEPDPHTYAALRANVADNALTDVTTHQCAVGKDDCTTTFYRPEDSGFSSLLMSTLRARNDGIAISVPMRRLSSFITENVDLLKLDIEGAEEDVLGEIAAAGALPKIKQIHLEYHHHIDSAGDRLSAVLALLEGQGFGYQVGARPGHETGEFQDIHLLAYRRTARRPS